MKRGRKLRVLQLSDYGYVAGGAELFIEGLSKELAARGVEVKVMATRAGRDEEGAKPRIAGEWCFGTTSPLRTVVQTANFPAARQVRRVVEDFRADVVHLHLFLTQLSPLVLRALRGIPVVYTAHWFRAVCMTGFKMLPDGSACRQRAGVSCLRSGCVRWWDWLPLSVQMRLLAGNRKHLTAVAASSEAIRRRLEADGFQVDVTIPYGIRPLRERPALEWPPRIGFAGRLVAGKGGSVLLRAFGRVRERAPDALLDIYGDGPELGALRRQAAELGLAGSVNFHGYLAQAELQEKLGTAWVQAAPTLFEEPGGLVALEAAWRGTAMVASDSGGFAESVADGVTGYLTPTGDVEKLAEALVALCRDRELAERLGRAGRARAMELFAMERMAGSYLDLYERLAGGKEAGDRC